MGKKKKPLVKLKDCDKCEFLNESGDCILPICPYTKDIDVFEMRLYKLELFETLKSLLSCSVEIYTNYKFLDLDYGFTKGWVAFNQLKQIEKSKEWKEILSILSKRKEEVC